MLRKELITGDALLELIPQRSPIVMIDAFYGLSDQVSYTGLRVTEENIFCEMGELQEYGLIEHIAQSAAARIGYLYRLENRKIPLGFIGSIDKMTIRALPGSGSELRTEIRVEQEVFGLTLVSAKVKCGEDILAEGQMKIFLKEEKE